MEIPHILINQIREGNVILFLGAGASFGAIHPDNAKIPIGKDLAEMIANNFLGSGYKHMSLSQIAELSISESDLFTVQSFIADIFKKYKPADFHKLIPLFLWPCIATTNYDLILEDAYQEVEKKLQKLVVFKKDAERIETKIRNSDNLMYIKLHGCITAIDDVNLPLILTPEQYLTHRENRERLFGRFFTLAYEYPILFVGHSLSDPDLRYMLLELDKLKDAKPRSFVLAPNMLDVEQRFWENHKITHIQLTFQDFLNKLSAEIPLATRQVIKLVDREKLAILQKYDTTTGVKPSESLEILLERDVEFVYKSMKVEKIDPKAFYKGYFKSFSAIVDGFDVKRWINDSFISERILINEDERIEKVEFYIIRGHAGSGKSVTLKRIAWDTATIFDKMCLFVKKNALLNYEALYELYQITKERIYLFIDPITDSIDTIEDMIVKAKKDNIHLTIIATARKNEWNINCENLEPLVSGFYEIKYLQETEINNLILLLKKHNSLGHLENMSIEKQRDELSQKSGRQLLVALHEATMGKPFTDIIFDEYNSIAIPRAQSLYLTICILHRLGVPVRAGLISRAHGISFTEFDKLFFKPLEFIVFVDRDPITKDYYYSSRHSHIAEIVFERVLRNSQDRFDEYMRILKSFDLSYRSDSEAFKGLMKAHQLISLFADQTMIRQLFAYAKILSPSDPMLLQQEAIFEMEKNNFTQSEKLLEAAYVLSPNNKLIAHSLSVLEHNKSKNSTNEIEKIKYREQSKKIASSIITNSTMTSHPYHTLIQIGIEELSEIIDSGDQPSIERKMKELEKSIAIALQKFPDEGFLLDVESQYATLIQHNPKALQSLERAFSTNKRSPYIASRLANIYESDSKYQEAINVLKECVDANPSDKNANYKLASLLMKYDSDNFSDIKFYLRRSFTEGDSNYVAQFWYARALYLNHELLESKRIFKLIANANIDSRIKQKPRGVVNKCNQNLEFTGVLDHIESTYGFIISDSTQDRIFTHSSFMNPIWSSLSSNQRIKYNLSFNYRGPVAIHIQKI